MNINHKVSIIMPIRNEAQFISRSLTSVLQQDYPPDLMEILLVDGMSEDTTRDIIAKTVKEIRIAILASQQKASGQVIPTVKVLDNHGRIVPIGFNIGLKEAQGDIIIRVDGHCEIQHDYVRRCVELIVETGADNVGGLQLAEGKEIISQAIALATSSPFGVGGAKFHYASKPGWVDTVFLGAYRKEVFERLGGFDEELVRNQDDEFNFRLIQNSGRIWLDPALKTVYYGRTSFFKLWRQYFQYGFYKVRVLQKRGGVASWRHLVPASFVYITFFTLILSVFTKNIFWFFLIIGSYFTTNFLASFWTTRRNWQMLPLVSVAFLILHFAYGCGFLYGLWHWRHYWKQFWLGKG